MSEFIKDYLAHFLKTTLSGEIWLEERKGGTGRNSTCAVGVDVSVNDDFLSSGCST